MDTTSDCIIAGGGAAGLSAALVLGRARRSVLLVDAGGQSNLSAHGVGGLLGHDRRPPAELYGVGRSELREYPSVRVHDGAIDRLVADAKADGDPMFTATLADGTTARARRVLLATGMEYRYPDVPGLAERWGASVFHCPFCHGWEVRARPLAVLGGGAPAVHSAFMLRAWSDDVTLVCGPDGVEESDVERLDQAGVAIEMRAAIAVRGPGTTVEAIDLADGGEVTCEGVLAVTTLRQRSSLAARLGVAFADPTPMSSDAIAVDPFQQTSVPGVYAAGDVLARAPSVANAIASGSMGAAGVVMSLFVPA